MNTRFIVPNWPAPANVRALVTTRQGGVSTGPYASFNLADHVGDDPAALAENRRILRAHLPAEPVWIKQVHGTQCRDVSDCSNVKGRPIPEADAAFSRQPGVVCAVLTADCLPVLLCDTAGTVVAAAHAGWRGLAAGVIEATIAALGVPGEALLAWLGPAISAAQFEVGDEVRERFCTHDPRAAQAFTTRPNAPDDPNDPNDPDGPCSHNGKWLCDIYLLARQRLVSLGVDRISSANFCTVRDAQQFFSYRRDGETGRMASLIWLAE